MGGSYWQRQTAAAIPPLRSVGALVEVLPSLSKYVIDGQTVRERAGANNALRQCDDGSANIQSTRNDQGSVDGLQRTKSEEMEAELILAKDMLKKEKEENALLLKTMSKLKESAESSLQDNEIMLLRDSILQKHDIINRLHAESVELSNKISLAKLRIQDNVDCTKPVRDKLETKARDIETELDDIEDEKLSTVQRIQQYQLLYGRTKDDRDVSQRKLLHVNDIVEHAHGDVASLESFHKELSASVEDGERKLGRVVALLDDKRIEWTNESKNVKKELQRLLSREEQVMIREKEAEEHAQMLEQQRLDRFKRMKEGEATEDIIKQRNSIHKELYKVKDSWSQVCAAAGLEPESSVEDVLKAWGELNSREAGLEDQVERFTSGEMEGDRDEKDIIEKCSGYRSSTTEGTVEALNEDNHEVSVPAEDCQPSQTTTPKADLETVCARAEMSLQYIESKIRSVMDPSPHEKAWDEEYLRSDNELELEPGDDESKEDPLVLRRRSSVHALHPRRMSAMHLQEERGDKAEETDFPAKDRECQFHEFFNATEWNFDIAFDTEKSKLIALMNQLVERHIAQGSTGMNKNVVSPALTGSEAIQNGPGNFSHEALQHLIQLAHCVSRDDSDKADSYKGDSHCLNNGNAWRATEADFGSKKENPFVLRAEQQDTPVLDRTFLKNRSKKLLAKLSKQKLHV
eukprot:jgi/Picsp_1/3750/NSC_06585-R1_hypothetical protein CHLNCDRAFT_138354 [Chlorella variabilis]